MRQYCRRRISWRSPALVCRTGSCSVVHSCAPTRARTEDELGVVRIDPATGEVDQPHVLTARWRWLSVATALTSAVGTRARARDWQLPGGDGERTADGDRLREASVWRHREAPLSNLAPPMAPFAERLG